MLITLRETTWWCRDYILLMCLFWIILLGRVLSDSAAAWRPTGCSSGPVQLPDVRLRPAERSRKLNLPFADLCSASYKCKFDEFISIWRDWGVVTWHGRVLYGLWCVAACVRVSGDPLNWGFFFFSNLLVEFIIYYFIMVLCTVDYFLGVAFYWNLLQICASFFLFIPFLNCLNI